MNNPEVSLREKILVTGKSLFIRHGYHGLAMRQISEAVGVSKPALYYHFIDKEELFVAIISSNLNEIEKNIDLIQAMQISSSEKMALFIEYVLNEPTENRAIIRLASQEMTQLSTTARQEFGKAYHIQFIGKLQKLFLDGIETGEFRTMDPAVATWALLGIMYPYFYPADTGAKPVTLETIQQIVSIYLSGVKKNN